MHSRISRTFSDLPPRSAGCDTSDDKNPTKLKNVYLYSENGDLVAEELVPMWEPTIQTLDYCRNTMQNIDRNSPIYAAPLHYTSPQYPAIVYQSSRGGIYEAPLIYHENSGGYERGVLMPDYDEMELRIDPGYYDVELHRGISLSIHEATIGTSLRPHTKELWDNYEPDRFSYPWWDVDDELLAAVRADPGVQRVEGYMKWHLLGS